MVDKQGSRNLRHPNFQTTPLRMMTRSKKTRLGSSGIPCVSCDIMKYKLHANFSFMQINLHQITNCILFYVNNCSSESTEDDVEKDVVEEATEIATEDSSKNIAEEANKVEEST